jgi:ATP-binding cassette, subfamily B, bacterial
VRVVKAFAQEEREIARFHPRSHELALAGITAEQTWMTVFPVLSFVTSTGALLVWYAGGRQVLAGEITLGTLVTFIAYLGMFYGPLQFLNRISEWLSRALASAERVFDVLDSEPDVREAEDAVPIPRIEGRVEFRNVTFGYDKHKPVLKGVSLEVAPGEMIGFVGHSGAGKSTMINLICRFYDVDDGQILVDGIDIRQIRQQDLRGQIGIVLQDTFLFNGTIAENIGYAKPGATPEEIMAAAKAANAHDFIVEKPDGYDTIVGERGQQLSGGERQRISIARAILHNPRILILDEATSSVDTDTEKQIQDAIARLIKGRTTFAIAHRLSTLRNADRLVVLKEGKVEEVGTHAELLEKKGEFHRLVEMQQEMSRIQAVAR